jgi:hypothetical protein
MVNSGARDARGLEIERSLKQALLSHDYRDAIADSNNTWGARLAVVAIATHEIFLHLGAYLAGAAEAAARLLQATLTFHPSTALKAAYAVTEEVSGMVSVAAIAPFGWAWQVRRGIETLDSLIGEHSIEPVYQIAGDRFPIAPPQLPLSTIEAGQAAGAVVRGVARRIHIASLQVYENFSRDHYKALLAGREWVYHLALLPLVSLLVPVALLLNGLDRVREAGKQVFSPNQSVHSESL